MSVVELIKQFEMSSELMKRAIASDDSGAVARLDATLSATLERIVNFRIGDHAERLEIGRFLTDYLENRCGGSQLSSKVSARMVELIGDLGFAGDGVVAGADR